MIKEYLQKLASEKLSSEDEEFNPQDYCGGNFDDAWSMGQDEGFVLCARALLEKFFKET